jgi:hypothetical protein
MMLSRSLALLLLALANSPSIADTSTLGRLFLDPQQRARLDLQRQHNPRFQPGSGEAEASQTINGEVRSSNGRRMRWINGEANWDGTTPARTPVGDTFNPATGEQESLLRGGSIRIKPGERRP